ncbi:MAG TPA: DUF3127 domain-containing protein [Cyclobacteriaceae bacterium]|nr:DUF3127 domain-containing protein [Cyclobacteriaceae bacterium]
MNIKGKVLEIFPAQQVRENFRKREFVVEYRENPQYAEFIKFEFLQEKCELLNDLKPGDEVEIQFNLRGRVWTNPQGEKVYFNSLQAWRIDKLKENVKPEKAGDEKPTAGFNEDLSKPDPTDDLPF